MRLLLITFVLDESHPALAWQVYVVRELAKIVEEVIVLTSHIGKTCNLPNNVEVITPPVRPFGIPHKYGGLWAFNWDIYKVCKKKHIDAVFVHMAKDWAYILCPSFKLLKIPVVMWYAHGTVSKKLHYAVNCVDRVVTSTPEGCRINDKKIKVIGQAINTEIFNIHSERVLTNVLYVGRINQRKRVDLLYQVHKDLGILNVDNESLCFDIVGAPISLEDLKYDSNIRSDVWQDGNEHVFRMHGLVPYVRIPEFYSNTFLHINVSNTGSMDKTVMEALSSGCPVLTSNTAFFDILKNYPEFLIHDERPEAIAEQVLHIYKRRHQYDPVELRSIVKNGHDLDTYADRILNSIDEVTLN